MWMPLDRIKIGSLGFGGNEPKVFHPIGSPEELADRETTFRELRQGDVFTFHKKTETDFTTPLMLVFGTILNKAVFCIDLTSEENRECLIPSMRQGNEMEKVWLTFDDLPCLDILVHFVK